jgi:hypothetical protein
MAERTFLPTDETVFAAVEQFVRQVLADGYNSAEFGCALAALAVRIGLDLAPSALVMRAVSGAVAESGASQTSQDADLDTVAMSCGSAMQFKRKSGRDGRSNNVAAERQRSSVSRDASALQVAFRRCHSDSEFRARFLANCRNQ